MAKIIIDTDDLVTKVDNCVNVNISQIVKAEVVRYINQDFVYCHGWRADKYRGATAIDLLINDTISEELTKHIKSIVAERLEQITNEAIKRTVISLRTNSKYDDLKTLIATIVSELDMEE